MSLLGKFMDTMRLSDEDDDDYFLDDDYEDEKPAKKGFFSRSSSYEDEEDEPEQSRPKFLSRSNSKVVPMRRGMEVSLVKPTSMEDSKDICDYLLAGKAVVLNICKAGSTGNCACFTARRGVLQNFHGMAAV